MPIGFSSPARNLFLLGGSGEGIVTNFFRAIARNNNESTIQVTSNQYVDTTKTFYTGGDNRYLSSAPVGSANRRYGFVEERDIDGILGNKVEVAPTYANTDLDLTDFIVDSSDNIVACGFTPDTGWIAKYDSSGGLVWSSTSNTANAKYRSVAESSDGSYYICGTIQGDFESETDNTTAIIEKFDSNGNPLWGRNISIAGGFTIVRAIALNSNNEIYVCGYVEDDTIKASLVKLTEDGDVIWDRTFESHEEGIGILGGYKAAGFYDITIDGKDQIFLVGSLLGTSSVEDGIIVKLNPQGNIEWQKQTTGEDVRYQRVKSDSETGQSVVTGIIQHDTLGECGIVTKYSGNGTVVFRRLLRASEANSPTNAFDRMALDADPSYYYLAFTDRGYSSTGSPDNDRYIYGRVSTSGNGLGDFEYEFDGNNRKIDYVIDTFEDRIGRLDDGSVRNDTSDLVTYPFGANDLMFDDYATIVSNKKVQVSEPNIYTYSGSPSLRPADFQEMNLLSTAGISREPDGIMHSFNVTSTGGYTANRGPDKGFDGNTRLDGGTDTFCQVQTSGKSVAWTPGFAIDTADEIFVCGISSIDRLQVYGSLGDDTNIVPGTVDGVTNVYTVPTNLGIVESMRVVSPSGTAGFSAIKVGGKILVDAEGKWEDQSTKGNDVPVLVTDLLKEPHPGFGSVRFDGADKYLSMPDSQLLELLDADFTVEFWIYPTGSVHPTFSTIFSKGDAVHCHYNSTHNSISFYYSNGTDANHFSIANLTGTDSITRHQWQHVAICRDGSSWKAFVNGVQKYSNVIPGLDPIYNSSEDFRIGDYGALPGDYRFQGYISNFRLLKGTALYAASFTVPTTPLTSTGSDTSVLTCQGTGPIVDARTGTPNVITGYGEIATTSLKTSPSYKDSGPGYWEFNGVDDAMSINSLPDFENITVEWWGTSDYSTTGYRAPIMKTTSTSWNNGFGFYQESGVVSWWVNQWNGGGVTETQSLTEAFGWTHWVGTYDGSDVKMYRNGVLEDSASYTTSMTNPNVSLDIGHSKDNYYWDGNIGEVRIYPEALTATEVFQNYNSTKTKYIHEAPEITPKIGPNIVQGSDLILNYDFESKACYDDTSNLLPDTIDILNDWTSGTNGPIETTNVASPIGTYDVFKVTTSSTDTNAIVYESIDSLTTQGFDYTFSFWVKSIDGSSGTWGVNYFANGHNRQTVPITGEWKRVSFSFTAGSGGENIYIGDNRDGLASIDEAYVWGPQLNLGNTLNSFVRTYGSAVTAPTTVKNLSNSSIPGTINGAVFSRINTTGNFDFGLTSETKTISTTGTNCSTLLGTTDSGGSCTIECWVDLDDTFNRQTILSGYNAGDNMRWDLEVDTGNLRFIRHANGTTSGTGGIDLDWNHVVVTRGDGSDARIRIYLNGSEVGTSLLGGPLGSGVPLGLGMRADGSTDFPLDGRIAEVRTYTRFLSATEISQNYNATRAKYGV